MTSDAELTVNPNSVGYVLARIETKLDVAIVNQAAHEAKDASRFDAVHVRLADVERTKHWVLGAAFSVGAIVSLFGDKVLEKVFS